MTHKKNGGILFKSWEIQILNRLGDRTPPCRTPFRKGICFSKTEPLTLTLRKHDEYQYFSKKITERLIPLVKREWKSWKWLTESKALEISRAQRWIDCLFREASKRRKERIRWAWLHPISGWKPNWFSPKPVPVGRCGRRICSNALLRLQDTVIGRYEEELRGDFPFLRIEVTVPHRKLLRTRDELIQIWKAAEGANSGVRNLAADEARKFHHSQ